MIPTIKIDDDIWDRKEHDWTGKTFYITKILTIFNIPLGLAGKLEQLNQDLSRAGYKIKTNMVLIEPGTFSSMAMIEVDKQNKYDANILHFDEQTNVETFVYKGPQNKVSGGMRQLAERVTSKRGMPPRKVMYMYTYSGSESKYKTILFALT